MTSDNPCWFPYQSSAEINFVINHVKLTCSIVRVSYNPYVLLLENQESGIRLN